MFARNEFCSPADISDLPPPPPPWGHPKTPFFFSPPFGRRFSPIYFFPAGQIHYHFFHCGAISSINGVYWMLLSPAGEILVFPLLSEPSACSLNNARALLGRCKSPIFFCSGDVKHRPRVSQDTPRLLPGAPLQVRSRAILLQSPL